MNILYNIIQYKYAIIGVCYVFSIILGLIIYSLSYLIAVQNPEIEKISAYECGFEPFEDARKQFDVRFYIVAILFIIFDIEVLYLFPWSVTLFVTSYESLYAFVLFIFILTVGFIYEIIKKALDWQ